LNTNRPIFCGFILLLLSYNSFAQNRYQIGLLPSINLNKKLENNWKLNFKTESRQELKRGIFKDNSVADYNYLLTDFTLVASRKILFNSSIAGGYLLRVEDGTTAHRLIQQFVVTRKYRATRLAFRLSTDQTFAAAESPEFRGRFRISVEVPLNGLSIDAREFYFKFNNEYLNAFQGQAYDLEVRLVPVLGYEINDTFKLETGLDYRINSFLDTPSRQRFWGVVSLYVGW
jgi:hypothetical protein